MPRYINEDDFCEYIRKNTTPSGAEWFISKIKDMPSADVVEVETLKKNIEANFDEARKLRDENSSEIVRTFQQGRMFGHKCDLEMIKREETK